MSDSIETMPASAQADLPEGRKTGLIIIALFWNRVAPVVAPVLLGL